MLQIFVVYIEAEQTTDSMKSMKRRKKKKSHQNVVNHILLGVNFNKMRMKQNEKKNIKLNAKKIGIFCAFIVQLFFILFRLEQKSVYNFLFY